MWSETETTLDLVSIVGFLVPAIPQLAASFKFERLNDNSFFPSRAMPTTLKRKSATPELDIDALFADLDSAAGQSISQVKKRTPKTRRLSRTPTRVRVSSDAEKPPTSNSRKELDTTANQMTKRRDREKQLQVLCDGLSDKENNVPIRFPASPRQGDQVRVSSPTTCMGINSRCLGHSVKRKWETRV